MQTDRTVGGVFTTATGVLQEFLAIKSYGHSNESAELLKQLFVLDWNESRKNATREVQLQGFQAQMPGSVLNGMLSRWVHEREEKTDLAVWTIDAHGEDPRVIKAEQKKASAAAEKAKRKGWYQRNPFAHVPTPEEERQAAAVAAARERNLRKQAHSTAPPLSDDELAFVRLKVRTGRILMDLHAGFCSEVEMAHPKPVPHSLLSFLATLVSSDFCPPGEEWFLPSERLLIELNPRGATRNPTKSKAILLVLNFVVSRALIPQLLMEHQGSLHNMQADANSAANKMYVATVIYWVTRAAMTKAFPGVGEGSLQAGDKKVKEKLASDQEQSHVLKEFWRIGWMAEQKMALLEIVDRVWNRAVEMEPSLRLAPYE